MDRILAQASSGGFWMPPQGSTVAPDVDNIFSFVLWITVFFTLLILVLMVVFVIKYRYRPGVRERADKAPTHSTALELTWTIIPTVIVLLVFYFGFRGYLHIAVEPPNAYEINVNAKMWNWEFIYPNGYVSPTLHVPVNTPIRLVLQSQDVIHSLFIPQFRLKKDVVPGRYNRFWFQATQISPPEGIDIFCAEYCGQGHSQMLTKAYVHDMDGFKKWLEEASNWETRMTPVQAGEDFYRTRGCTQCHTVDGTRLVGPSLKNVFGEEQTLSDGSKVIADENYIRESLYEPAAKIVAGFTPQMPSYKATLKERDVHAIVEYLKSISERHKSETISIEPAGAATRNSASAPATAPTAAPVVR